MTSSREGASFYGAPHSGYRQHPEGGYSGSSSLNLPPMLTEDDATLQRRKPKLVKEWLLKNVSAVQPRTDQMAQLQAKGRRQIPRWPTTFDVTEVKGEGHQRGHQQRAQSPESKAVQGHARRGQLVPGWPRKFDDVINSRITSSGSDEFSSTVLTEERLQDSERSPEVGLKSVTSYQDGPQLPQIATYWTSENAKERDFERWGKSARDHQKKRTLAEDDVSSQVSDNETVLFENPEIRIKDFVSKSKEEHMRSYLLQLPRKNERRKLKKESNIFETNLEPDSIEFPRIELLKASQKRLLLAEKYLTNNDRLSLVDGSSELNSRHLSQPIKIEEESDYRTTLNSSSSTVEEWEDIESWALKLFPDFSREKAKENIMRARFAKQWDESSSQIQQIPESEGRLGDKDPDLENKWEHGYWPGKDSSYKLSENGENGKESFFDLRDLQLFVSPAKRIVDTQTSHLNLSSPSEHCSIFHRQAKENLNEDSFKRPLRAGRKADLTN